MNKKLINAGVALALLAGSQVASAQSVPASQWLNLTVDGASANFTGVFGQAPDDLWGITLDTAGHFGGSAISYVFQLTSTGFNQLLAPLTISLWEDTDNDSAFTGADTLLSTDSGFDPVVIGYLAAQPQKYFLQIAGIDGYNYAGQANAISTVPLPAAGLLFAPALLGLGALRRKQAKANLV